MTAPWRSFTTGDLLRNVYFVYEQKRLDIAFEAVVGRKLLRRLDGGCDEDTKKLFLLPSFLAAVILRYEFGSDGATIVLNRVMKKIMLTIGGARSRFRGVQPGIDDFKIRKQAE
ncbi:unnamed protein product, partial [Mesorhabditis spiculigera]